MTSGGGSSPSSPVAISLGGWWWMASGDPDDAWMSLFVYVCHICVALGHLARYGLVGGILATSLSVSECDDLRSTDSVLWTSSDHMVNSPFVIRHGTRTGRTSDEPASLLYNARINHPGIVPSSHLLVLLIACLPCRTSRPDPTLANSRSRPRSSISGPLFHCRTRHTPLLLLLPLPGLPLCHVQILCPVCRLYPCHSPPAVSMSSFLVASSRIPSNAQTTSSLNHLHHSIYNALNRVEYIGVCSVTPHLASVNS